MTSYQGKKKTVYVYMHGSQENLEKKMKEEFSTLLSKISITCVFLKGKEQLKDECPLIVLCPIYSRVQSDIDCVLQKLQHFPLPDRFALAVIYMTREDCLPRFSTETMLNPSTDDYSNIHFIDMAFTREHLMYDCNMNKTATEKIKCFVNNMYQEERSCNVCVVL